MGQAFEGAQGRDQGRPGQADGLAQGEGGEGVGHVVQAAHRQILGVQQRRLAARQPAVGQAEIRFGRRLIQAEGEDAPAAARHGHDAPVLAIEHLHGLPVEDPRLCRGILVQAGIAIEVIVADVEHRRRVCREALRGFQLEAGQFEHPDLRQLARIEAGHQGAERGRADVARHRRPPAGGTAKLAGHGGGRRLAVGAGDGDELAAVAQAQFAQGLGEQLDLADDGDAACGAQRHHRLGEREAGRQPEQVDALEQLLREATGDQMRGRRGASELGGMGRLGTRVGHAHPRPPAVQPLRHGQAALAQAENQCGFALEFHRSFKVDSPNSTSMMVIIQKRTTTWVSFQPSNS